MVFGPGKSGNSKILLYAGARLTSTSEEAAEYEDYESRHHNDPP